MVGRVILDRFRIARELGRGGFGTVYVARDERLQRDVAVKALSGGRAGERVLREAQAAARLNHASIVTLYELGEDADRVYLVSELVDGETLRELLTAGALSDRDVGEGGIGICEALAHAHERGVVHRDVKPENIAISRWRDDRPGPWSRTSTGRAMLMDFGVASLAGEARITRTGEVVGTLAYMAPEQAEGAQAGPAADVYSLALVLYEAWSGANPVARATPAATARAIGTPPPPLSVARPDLPAELTEAVDACLDPDPDLRPTALELAEALADTRPRLDGSRALPLPDGAEEPEASAWPAALARVGVLVVLAVALAYLAWPASSPGLAAALAALSIPPPLLFERPREWLTPLAAPFLGLVGLAPLYPALAGLAGGPRRCAALGLLGWCWLAAAEGLLGEPLLFGAIDDLPAGWEASATGAVEGLLLPLLAPASLAGAAAWAGAAALLGALLDSRSLVIKAVGALGWGAGLVAVHRLLAGGAPDPATAGLVGALVVTLGAAVWLRSTAPERPARKPAAAVMARGTA
jgi:tRNA A-37 threonylcarbamoyl transferase component Bud32